MFSKIKHHRNKKNHLNKNVHFLKLHRFQMINHTHTIQ